MNYEETIAYLFAATPRFEMVGRSAYKPGLERVVEMAAAIGNPHKRLHCIHVAGTNGKGSTSSTLAAVLHAAGLRVGLFTSPHLVDFRERIRVGGHPISQEYVVDFVSRTRPLIEQLAPSFFELTTLMAFEYFAHEACDVAVIEVGLGGRLDSTNIIEPLLSIVTNISLDHTQFLGNTLPEIAHEKAGIFKPETFALVGEASPELKELFRQEADAHRAHLHFAEEHTAGTTMRPVPGGWQISSPEWGSIFFALAGAAQQYNARTILAALSLLRECTSWRIDAKAVAEGMAHVAESMKLLGRWQTVEKAPRIILDTGHNEAGIAQNVKQLEAETFDSLHVVFGMVEDKDRTAVMRLLPTTAHYYFVMPKTERAVQAVTMQQEAGDLGLKGESYPSVAEAIAVAKRAATNRDLIYVGGSNYVVAAAIEEVYPHLVESN